MRPGEGPNVASTRQRQTQEAFAFKWARRGSYESPTFQAKIGRWLMERYCDGDASRLDRWLSGGRKIILDAGCGSGMSAVLFFGERLKHHDYLGVDLSSAVEVARERFRERGYPGDFLQRDLMDLDVEEGRVDLIFCEGVLHHTDSTEGALKHLTAMLKLGGRFLFYVYAKKSPLREFTDDHVRQQLASLTDEQAWEALKPLTQLGVALGKLDMDVDVPEEIPYLGIPKGKIPLQRLFYWHVCKMYYDPSFSLEEMNHVNFDWFRPLNCHRHTVQEIESYCSAAGLVVERLRAENSGITVVARKGNA
ncbi:MAG: class I SAM-dependent methyltransferase [Planctomycetes bacterium]|nr:class I SAM-dependent methyltransferase [Planctomycetota bacterium]